MDKCGAMVTLAENNSDDEDPLCLRVRVCV